MRHRTTNRICAAAVILLAVGVTVWSEDTDSTEERGLWERFLAWRAARIAVTDTYLVSLQGPAYSGIQDTRMTPLVYRAVGGALCFQSRTYRPNVLILSSAFLSFNTVLSKETLGGVYSYNNPRATVSGTYFHGLGLNGISLGGGMSVTGNMRLLDQLSNSSYNYDIVADIHIAGRRERSFRLFDRPAEWHVELAAPLFSFVVRHPSYGVSYQGSASHWAPPWRLYRARLNVGLSRLLTHSEENRLALDYMYDLYGMRDRDSGHKLTLGLHTIVLGYALKAR